METPTHFLVGDAVEKTTGDYVFYGVVVACFAKRGGAIRYVVENKDGMLFIFNHTQLKPCADLDAIEGTVEMNRSKNTTTDKRYAILISDKDKNKIPVKYIKKNDSFTLYEPDGEIVGYFTADDDAYLYDRDKQIYMVTVKAGTLDERTDQKEPI